MKRVVLFMLLAAMGLGAVCQMTSIKTPTNLTIEAIVRPELSPDMLAEIEAYAAVFIANEGWDAVQVGPASQIYNCHNYAWHSSDGGARRWVNQHNISNGPNVSNYWSGTAPTFTATTSAKGIKVFYPNGDHSAIVVAPGVFRSKWGAWPLYEHPPTHSPYNATGLQYYHIPVNGNELICNSGNYSTLNIASATYTWTGSSSINLSSSNTANAVATRVNDGTAWIQAQISSPFSGTTVNTERRDVWVGVPTIDFSEVTFENAVGGEWYWCSTHEGNVFQHNPYGQQISRYSARLLTWPQGTLFRSAPNAVPGADPFSYVPYGWYIFELEAYNACGISETYATEIEYVDCYDVWEPWFELLASPNPASSRLTVDVKAREGTIKTMRGDERVTYQLFDTNRSGLLLSASTSLEQSRHTLDVSSLQPGQYVLKVTVGKETVSRHILIF